MAVTLFVRETTGYCRRSRPVYYDITGKPVRFPELLRLRAPLATRSKTESILRFWVSVTMYDGEQLNLTRITRNEMGAYLCIATNGVPPTVSKRITVDVECEFVAGIYYLLRANYHYPATKGRQMRRDRLRKWSCNGRRDSRTASSARCITR